MQHDREERCEHGDHADGDERGDPPATRCRLAVAAGPEAGEREHEGGDAERVEGEEVDDEAARESRGGAGDRAAQEPEADDHDEEQVRRASADEQGGEEHCLEHRGGEDDAGQAQRAAGGHGRSLGTSTITASRPPKSTNGSTCTCWKRSVSVWPTLVTLPMAIPFGYSELRPAVLQPLVTTSSPTRMTSSLRTRSRTSVSRVPRACSTMPSAPVPRSIAETAACWSVRSWMRAVPRVTRVTMPTSPSAVTAGSLSRTPSREPAATTIACEKAFGGRPMTSAVTGSKSPGKRGPSMYRSRRRR